MNNQVPQWKREYQAAVVKFLGAVEPVIRSQELTFEQKLDVFVVAGDEFSQETSNLYRGT